MVYEKEAVCVPLEFLSIGRGCQIVLHAGCLLEAGAERRGGAGQQHWSEDMATGNG